MSDGDGPYIVLPQPQLSEGEITVRAVCPRDIEPIRVWRNAQMDVLRQNAPISEAAQSRYYATQIWPQKLSSMPDNILLAIEKRSELIGYGGLVHIDWADRRAEISLLLDPEIEARPKARAEIFRQFLMIVKRIAFEHLDLAKLTVETFETRSDYIRLFDEIGFAREGRLRGHVLIDGVRVNSILHGLLRTDMP